MTSERSCYVYIVPPGSTGFVTARCFRLSETPDGEPIGEFVYGRRYLERPDVVEFDPIELRLHHGALETARMGGFFGAIRDAMPDYWGRCVIEHHSGRVRLEDFDYLIEAPDDRAGALGFGSDIEPLVPQCRFNRTLGLERIQSAADALIKDISGPIGSVAAQVEALLLLGTSMGGARPKAVMEGNGDLWIAKFGRPDDRWNQPRVEHALLNLARRYGLQVADSRLATVGNRDILLVRRFDRDATVEGYRRHRMISALTLLRVGDAQADRSGWSYILLADEIRRVSASPEADLHDLFRRMCFNAAISSLDDHPRNHAVIAKDRGWRLSPAYDLTPMPQIAIDRCDLAMICGRYGRYANRTNLLSEHGRFLLTKKQAVTVLNRVMDTVRSEWRAELRRTGVSEGDCTRIESAFLYAGLFNAIEA